MQLKDNYDLNQELSIVWTDLKKQSAQPVADYAALIEWLCDLIKVKAQKVMADDPVEADEADDWEDE